MLDLGSSLSGQVPDILGISETQLMLRNSRIASKCYDSKGNVTSEQILSYDIVDSSFTFSSTSNKLTVLGCDDYALISGYTGILANGSKHEYNGIGCLSLCSNPIELTRGSCSGLGCSQTSIPSGLQSFTITLSSLRNHTAPGIGSFQQCAYAFLARNDSFTFGGAPDFARNGVLVNRIANQVPLMLDWSIGELNFSSETRPTCDEARKNSTTYACQMNTKCIDVSGRGYHCECLSGYQGNPYLEPGCTDIDECMAGSDSLCTMSCINTLGSYKCFCPKGYSGDGYKSGKGCTKIENNSLMKITIGLSIALGSILLLLGGWWLYMVMKKRKATKQKAKYFERNGGMLLQQQISSDETVVERTKMFTSDELEEATNHFSADRILGQGGQGTVYKGMLRGGRIVAIKKSKVVNESQQGDFINEMVILSQINHRNVVKLLGCCLETEVPLLVYEFIPNGTLFHQIHYPNEEFPITWKMRLQIATDSASALAYLHSSSSIPIFHRDIKSSNILLDDKYRAKLSDFGTSRSVAVDQTHITTRVLGTFGYLDPEYFQSSQFTEKSDVYSFGVVLVELLTGEKAIRSTTQEDKSLISWFLSHMEDSCFLDVVDSQVLQEGSENELLMIASLAKQCLNLDGKRRPTMQQVLAEIEVVRSLHPAGRNQQHRPKAEQVLTKRMQNIHRGTQSSSTSASYLESGSVDSAELSLLFNPR